MAVFATHHVLDVFEEELLGVVEALLVDDLTEQLVGGLRAVHLQCIETRHQTDRQAGSSFGHS